MTRTEITTAQFAAFLRESGHEFRSPQFVGVPGRYVPLSAREPVVFVGYEEARAFASWFAERLGVEAGLPTVEEWFHAARGGLDSPSYPWGEEGPVGRAAFRLDRIRPVGSYPPNRFRLYDLAGNAGEWCRADAESPDAPVCGGSWRDENPVALRIGAVKRLPKDYRGPDVGFRLIARPLSNP